MPNVLVTGGSRGLGLAIVRKLVGEGHCTIALARHKSAALSSLMEDAPDLLQFLPFDLSEIRAIPDLVASVRRKFGPLFGLVNNAAVGTSGLLATMHNAQIEHLIRVNTVSPVVLTKYVVRHMMAGRSGRVINIASILGLTGSSGLAVYGATKAAIIGFTRSLAREVGPLGINVNAVAPGLMATDMVESLVTEQRAQIARRSALQRFPEVDEVAEAVAFLLSDRAKSITGTVLTVDAGATA